MSALNSRLTLNCKRTFKNKALHYCLKNGKLDKNSGKFSFKDTTNVKFK
jgi:hypothetical protein